MSNPIQATAVTSKAGIVNSRQRSNTSLFKLLQLCSPNLPVGSYSFSQGIEWAIERGWITNSADTAIWMTELVSGVLRNQELPLLLNLYDACAANDVDSVDYWSSFALACRETNELREEERHRGKALQVLLSSMPDLPARQFKTQLQKTQLAGLAFAGSQWGVGKADLAAGFAYSWIESLVYASLKIVPLGQTDAQKILLSLDTDLSQAVEYALSCNDDFPVYSSPAIAIASSRHETQYSRLFRS